MRKRLQLLAAGLAAACAVAGTVELLPWWARLSAANADSAVKAEQQRRVVASFHANSAINAKIDRLLGQVPSAVRARVSLIHRAAPGVPLRIDVTHAAGRVPGDLFANAPISQWGMYLDGFTQGRCVTVRADDPKASVAVMARLTALNAAVVIGCPLLSDEDDLLGGVFLTWAAIPTLPNELARASVFLKEAAAAIALNVPDL